MAGDSSIRALTNARGALEVTEYTRQGRQFIMLSSSTDDRDQAVNGKKGSKPSTQQLIPQGLIC